MAAMITPTGNEGQANPRDQGWRHPKSTSHGTGLTTPHSVQAIDTVPESPGAPETHNKAADSGKCGLLGLLPTSLSWRLLYSPLHTINLELWQFTCFSQARTKAMLYKVTVVISIPRQIMRPDSSPLFLPSSLPFFLISLSYSLLTFCEQHLMQTYYHTRHCTQMSQVPVSLSGSVQSHVETDIRTLDHEVALLLSQC